jgi:hypothetical protein
LNVFPWRPCRLCLKNTGPGEVNFIAKAMKGIMGTNKTSTIIAAKQSVIRFKLPG